MGLSKIFEQLMADEARAKTLAQALGKVQRGKQAFDRGQEEVMRALGFASKADFKEASKKLASLKRRVRELGEKLDRLS